MTISVCMGIYNGAKYLEEQLLSILQQTRQPDEVILCDDISKDGSAALVQSFIDKHHLQGKWKLVKNAENKGYPANFYYAMSLCTGDIVFLADQDDIWQDTKLEKMQAVLEKYKEANALCCKFGLIDGEGKAIQSVMQPAKSAESGSVKNIAVEEVFYKCEWPGMVLAYRNAWYRKRAEQGRLQTDKIKIPHDFLICAAAAEENSFLQLDEELAYHRRHDNNTGGEEHKLSKLLNRKRKLKEIEDYLFILEKFQEEQVLCTENGREALERKLISMKGRYEALLSGKFLRVLLNAKANRGSVRAVTLICDMIIVKQKG